MVAVHRPWIADAALGKEGAAPELVPGVGGIQQQGGILRQGEAALPFGAAGVLQLPALLIHREKVEHDHVRPALQRLQHFRHGAGGETVVTVQKQEILAPGGLDARVAGAAQTPVLLPDQGDQRAIAAGIVLRNGGGIVRGAVVHQDELHIPGQGIQN